MACQSQGVLILEKVRWLSSDYSDPCLNNLNSVLNRSCDLQQLQRTGCLSHGRSRSRFSSKSGKKSIFDIFWEQLNAPLKSQENGHWITQHSNHVESGLFSNHQPWAIPLGCYNVYM